MASVKQLSENLICPICHGLFDSPKLLPCSHTFCHSCLVAIVPRHSGEMECPVCRQRVIVHYYNVAKLPTNRIAKSMAEDLKREADKRARRRAPSEQPCTVCDAADQDTATHFCQHCSEFLCDRCLDKHSQYKQSFFHEVVKVKDIQSGDVRKQFACPKHPRELQQFVCIKCLKRICCRCMDIEHQSEEHKIVDIAKYMASQKKDCEVLQQEITQKTTVNQNYLSFVEGKQRVVKYSIGQRKREILSAYNTADEHLRRRRDELLKECTTYEDTLCKKLEGIIKCHRQFHEMISFKACQVKDGTTRLHHLDKSLAAHAAQVDGLRAILKEDVLRTFLPTATDTAVRAEYLTFQPSPPTNPLHLGTVHIREDGEGEPQGNDATSLTIIKNGKVTFTSRNEKVKLPFVERRSVRSTASDRGPVLNFFSSLYRRMKGDPPDMP